MFIQTTYRPVIGALHGKFLIGTSVMQSSALIKGKDDVGANFMLNLHGYFGGEAMHRAIEVRFKGNAVIINMSQTLFISGNNLIRSKGGGIHSQYFFETNTE